MPYDALFYLKASGAETASANGSALDLKTGTQRRGFKARLLCTAASGTTPTLDVKIQVSDDGSTWRDLVVFPRLTGPGEEFVTFETSARYARYASAIAGTNPSFTYGIDLGLAYP